MQKFENTWTGGTNQGKGSCNWYDEIFEKQAELIECNTTLTNIPIGVKDMSPSPETLCQKLGKALSQNLVLEKLSFPVWAPTNPSIFHTVGPFIKKNKSNGGNLKTMKFFTSGL